MKPDILIALTTTLTAGAAAVALAQNVPTVPQAFPDGAQPLAAEALAQRLGGQVFDSRLATGEQRRLEFKADGYVFLDVSTGTRATGRWRTEGSRLCVEWQRLRGSGCNEMRLADEVLYLQRDNGEVVRYDRR